MAKKEKRTSACLRPPCGVTVAGEKSLAGSRITRPVFRLEGAVGTARLIRARRSVGSLTRRGLLKRKYKQDVSCGGRLLPRREARSRALFSAQVFILLPFVSGFGGKREIEVKHERA